MVCFDIETIPDVVAGRRLYQLDGLDDAQVAAAMFQHRRQQSGREFLRHHLQRIAAISIAARLPDGRFIVRSVGTVASPEAELIRRFFQGIEKYTPTLVSWNGAGFDLPVLHYRSLVHGVAAPRYWETGEEEHGFRWNNYLGRFHWRHTDLMDVLAGYQGRAVAPLDEIAVLLGLPGKLGMHGSLVWDCHLRGEIERIRNYCDTDVINTYLIYLRFQLIRGRFSSEEYEREVALVRDYLQQTDESHLQEYLAAWAPGS